MTPKEALANAIRVLGSQTAVAEVTGVATGHVYYWLSSNAGVPAKYCPAIEQSTREKGETVFCEHLCPDADWALVRAQRGPEIAVEEG